MPSRVPVFAANWKMNKRVDETASFVKALSSELQGLSKKAGKDFGVVIAPQATHLSVLKTACQGTAFEVSAQNCGHAKSGAFTGEVSPVVLKEVGCAWVILGHSERRHVYLEDDARVLARTKAALEEGLGVIFCVGETLQERKAGQTMAVVEKQLSVLSEVSKGLESVILAYEPVWAIGTGETATPAQAEEVQAFIRGWLSGRFGKDRAENTRILYGGSVKPENSQELMSKPNVDGFLVGGASLEPGSFAGIIRNGLKARE